MCKAWQLAVWLWQDLPLRAPHLQGFGGKKGNITPVCAPSLPLSLNLLLSVMPSPDPFSTVTLKYPISLIFFFFPLDPLKSVSLEGQRPKLDPSETEEDGEVIPHLLPAWLVQGWDAPQLA